MNTTTQTGALDAPEHDGAGGTNRPPGTVMASLGAISTSVAVMIAVAADPGALVHVIPPLALGLVTGVLAWFFGTWSTVLAGVWGVAALAQLPATPIPLGLPRPDSFFDFVPGWLFVIGAVTAVVGGVVGIVRRRRTGAVGLERRWLAAASLVVVALAALSAIVSMTTGSTLSANERAGAVEVRMVDSAYEPRELVLDAGEVSFAVRNDGNVLHTFTVDELGIDQTVAPGDEVLITTSVTAGDELAIYCRPHAAPTEQGWAGMAAKMVVR